jgi:hypothetical protein
LFLSFLTLFASFSSLSGWSSLAYNIPFAAKVLNKIDEKKLLDCFHKLVERHSALRTVFVDSDHKGEMMQVVKMDSKLDFENVDAKGWSDKQIQKYMLDFTYQPFDLENVPPVKLRFIHRGDELFILWTIHHIIVDLWSFVVMLEDLGALYLGQKIAAPATQYIQCVPSLLDPVTSNRSEKLWAYWQTQLAEPLPILQLPIDKVRPAKPSYRGEALNHDIPLPLLTQLRQLAKAESVTLYALLLAAYYTLLHVYTGQEDIVVGSPLSGRSELEREHCVGYFVNPLPLRSNLSGNPSFRTYLSRVRSTVVEGLAHDAMPLPLLVERLGTRDSSRSALFQVCG